MRRSVLLLYCISSLALAVGPSRPPGPHFPIGQDTTFVDGPLDEEGYIDYAAAINRHLGRDVRPKDNAVVLLWRAFGPLIDTEPVPPSYFAMLGVEQPPEKGEYVIPLSEFAERNGDLVEAEDSERLEEELTERAMRTAWTAKELPRIAAWLKANEKPLTVIREAALSKSYFSPLLPETKNGRQLNLTEARLPSTERPRAAAQMLVAHALLMAGEGKTDTAWRELVACERLGRLVGQGGCLYEAVAGVSIRCTALLAVPGFLSSTRPDKARLARYLADLQARPPSADLAGKIDVVERLILLDVVQHFHRRGLTFMFELGGPPREVPLDVRLMLWMGPGGVDYVPTMQAVNAWQDRCVAALRTPKRTNRIAQLVNLRSDFGDMRVRTIDKENMRQLFIGAPSVRGERAADLILALAAPGLMSPHESAEAFRQLHDNTRVVIALEMYHRDHEAYPKKLSALAPKYLKTVPKDLFSGKALVYKPDGKGYLLYSVGPDEEDEQGEGDDIAVRMPPAKK
jgi:hypothetical protein